MVRLAAVILGALVLTVAVNIAWRWVSRRRSVPCPSWLAWGLEGPFFSWLYRTEPTLDRIRLQAGQRVLEIGPGPGRLLIPAARRVLPDGEAVGIDVQESMVARLNVRASAAGIDNLSGIVGDAADALPPGEFDVIFLALALGEIPRQSEALAHVLGALRPGGRLSITEMFPDPHFLSQKAVRRLAETAGLQHEETLGSPWFYTSNFVKEGRSTGAPA